MLREKGYYIRRASRLYSFFSYLYSPFSPFSPDSCSLEKDLDL